MKITPSARLTAGLRALEGERTDRPPLVRDPFADALAGPEGREAARRFAEAKPEAVENILLRHRWIDGRLADWDAMGLDRVVLLGAGLDTRAHRLGLRARFIEVDLPGAAEAKAARIRDIRPAPDPVLYVGADLRRIPPDRLLAQLPEAESCRTAVVAEGLLCYLETEAALDLLERTLGAPALWLGLLFDFFDPSYAHDSPGNRRALDQLREGGEEIVGLLEPERVDALLPPGSVRLASDAASEARRVLDLDRDTGYLHFRGFVRS